MLASIVSNLKSVGAPSFVYPEPRRVVFARVGSRDAPTGLAVIALGAALAAVLLDPGSAAGGN